MMLKGQAEQPGLSRKIGIEGPVGVGKSTLLKTLLETWPGPISGLVGVRIRERSGRLCGFRSCPAQAWLQGRQEEALGPFFLDFSAGYPRFHQERYYEQLRAACSEEGTLLLLDEWGGLELLYEPTFILLYELFSKDIPIVHVRKEREALPRLLQQARLDPAAVRTLEERRSCLAQFCGLMRRLTRAEIPQIRKQLQAELRAWQAGGLRK